jgi:hypothetical protein
MTRHLAAFLFGLLVSALLLATTANADPSRTVTLEINEAAWRAMNGDAPQATECERMKRRYDRACVKPTPTPGIPSPTKPTPEPKQCDAFIGKNPRGFFLDPDKPMLFCFDVPADFPNAFVEVKHWQTGNAQCAKLDGWLSSPAGGQSPTGPGNQLGGLLPKAAGRWYWSVRLIEGCRDHTFYWR